MQAVSQHLPLSSIPNCRDLGGIPTKDGAKVRSGMLIRSANLHHASPQDLHTLDDLGVRTVVDLRTSMERKAQLDKILPSWKLVDLPMFEEHEELHEQLHGLFKEPGTFIQHMYATMLELPSAQACIRKFFTLLIDTPGSYLWHCTQGKDRTGIIAIFVLSALNVDESLIEGDYLQTNMYMDSEKPKHLENLEKILGSNIDADIDEFMVARPSYYQALVTYTEQFGGFQGYLRSVIGLNDDDFTVLRKTYVEA